MPKYSQVVNFWVCFFGNEYSTVLKKELWFLGKGLYYSNTQSNHIGGSGCSDSSQGQASTRLAESTSGAAPLVVSSANLEVPRRY